MANRIIRESICVSDTIDMLSFGAECTFYRLLVNVDDYGRIDARTKVLKAKLYPIRDMLLSEFEAYMDELYASGLIWQYEAKGKPYIQVRTWDQYQQIRAKRSKCPAPDDACNHMISDDIKCVRSAALNPNPNPNPNPKWNPNPEPAQAREDQTADASSVETDVPAATGIGSVADFDDGELAKEREIQDCADELVKAYGLARNSIILDEITKDIHDHGTDAVRDAFKRAAASDTRGGISLAFYRACLTGKPGGKAGPPGKKMVNHTEAEWQKSQAAIITDENI